MTTQENPTLDLSDTSEANLPTVSFNADKTVIVEGGDAQLTTFNLSQPALAGGLPIKLRIDDPDGEPGDTDNALELFSNITDFGTAIENGIIIANITIAEGTTEATIGIKALTDNQVEGDETYSLTLLENENYIVDSASTTITTTIEDATTKPTVSLTPATVTATEGETFAWNFSLDQAAPSGGLSLFLPITENSDPAPGDVEYFVEGSNNISDFEFVTTSSISQIYAFGDSYSDDGLSFEISTAAVEAGVEGSFILPADPELGLYDPEGRWTNGPTAVEVLSETLDVDLTDYAVGGAKSGAGNYYSWLDSFQDTGVFGQIEQFSTELAGEAADPDALYFIFASANDLFEYTDFGLPGTVEELAAQTVENIVEGVTDLSELGAEQFLVVNSSDLDILPGIIEFGQVEQATVFTDEVNELLPEALAALSQELGVEIALYDHVAISDEIRSNPTDFGLTNVDDPYQPVFPVEPPASESPDEYYFWDEYHPTRRVHEIIGEDMASFVNSEIEDEVSVGFNLTIAEGATEATLVSEVIVDDLEEGEESFTTAIADGENYNVNPAKNQVVTNLLDNGDSPTMTTVSIAPNTLIATEGETFAWDFSLDQPAPAGGLSLFLPVTVNNDPAPGDVEYFIEGSSNISDFEFVVDDGVSLGFNLTITEGATEATLVSEAVADDISEIDEVATIVVADGANYRANPEQNQVNLVLTELPVVSLTSSEVTAAEGETFAWDFSLNQPAPEGGLSIFLPVTANNDPAPGDVEYFVEGSSNISDFEFVVEDGVSLGFNLTIAEGATEATLVSEAVADDIEEGDEIATIVIADGENYRANPAQNQVVLNIPEDGSVELPTPTTVSIAPSTLIATEGETFAWDFSLDQPAPVGGLSLFLPVTVNNDPAPGDAEFFVEGSSNITDFEFVIEDGVSIGFNLTIAEGETEATLVSEVIADDITEIDEIATIVVADGENYRANPEQNQVTTVFTDLPVVSLTSSEVTAAEGETFAWDFSLNQPAPSGGLSLFLPVTANNDPAPGDVEYFVEGSSNITNFEFVVEDGVSLGFNLTIAEGATEATLVSEAVADDVEEGDEIATIVIADGENYRANPAQNQVVLNLLETTAEPTVADQIVSFELEDIFIPVQGGVVSDTTITIDQIDGLESFPDIVPLAEFVKDFLNTYPEPDEFFQDISNNLSQAILDSTELGFADTVDAITVNLERQPAGIVPFFFSSEATNAPEQPSNQIVSFNLQDILVPVQGGTVADATITIDQIDGLDTFPDIVPVADFVREFLTDYPNPNDFYQTIGTNLSEAILDNPELGFSDTADLISVELEREAAGIVPFSFSSEAIAQPTESTDKIVSFELEDIFIPVQGGVVSDTTITIDQIDGLESFPDIVPLAEFVKDFLNTYPNPDEFFQDISNNLSQAILDSTELGFADTVDAITVNLERQPAGIVPFFFSSEATNTPSQPSNQIVSFNLQDILVPVQGGTVADATITIDQIDGLDTFPDIVPVADFVREFLTNYPNPNDFYQTISNNLSQAILDNPELGFSNTVDSISVELERKAAGIVPFNFSSEGIITVDGDSNVPTVGLSVEPEVVTEDNDQYSLTLNLSEPAPIGGLRVIFSETDSDNAFGDIEFPPELTNASNLESLDAVGDELARSAITIDEGATEAIITWTTIPDGETEGEETTNIELEAAEGYNIDSDNQTDIVTILDTSVATGDETIVGDDGDNVLDGKDGDDLVAGGLGNDEIFGGDGDDILRGDLNSSSSGGTVGGNDTISGGAGDDRIGGKAGDDELYGDEGNDLIYGDDGDDLIRGGLGNDILVGDNFSGGSGADTFVLVAGEGTDTIVDFEVGVDIIGLADGLMAGDLAVTAASGNTTIALGDETLAVLEGVVSVDQIDFALV